MIPIEKLQTGNPKPEPGRVVAVADGLTIPSRKIIIIKKQEHAGANALL